MKRLWLLSFGVLFTLSLGAVAADDGRLCYTKRFDARKSAVQSCSWPASTVTLRFRGTGANVRLRGELGVRWQLTVDGKPDAVPTPTCRMEVIDDSIRAGFGHEAASPYEPFRLETANANVAYGALASRELNADDTYIAWSDIKLWPDNSIVNLYDRILPSEAELFATSSGGRQSCVLGCTVLAKTCMDGMS